MLVRTVRGIAFESHLEIKYNGKGKKYSMYIHIEYLMYSCISSTVKGAQIWANEHTILQMKNVIDILFTKKQNSLFSLFYISCSSQFCFLFVVKCGLEKHVFLWHGLLIFTFPHLIALPRFIHPGLKENLRKWATKCSSHGISQATTRQKDLHTSQHPEDYHVPAGPWGYSSETGWGHWDMTGMKLSIRPVVRENINKVDWMCVANIEDMTKLTLHVTNKITYLI